MPPTELTPGRRPATRPGQHPYAWVPKVLSTNSRAPYPSASRLGDESTERARLSAVRLASVQISGFKRFTDLRISDLPSTAKVVVVAGPNGSGKSSLFDAFKSWHASIGAPGYSWDEAYGTKVGSPSMGWPERVKLELHGDLPGSQEDRKKLVYVRTAFRNEADFTVNNFSRMASPLDVGRISRMIDNDMSVSDNFQRLIMQTIDGVYDESIPDATTKGDLRDRIIGRVREAMSGVFPDLLLTGVGGVGSAGSSTGTFYFDKGAAKGFLYKNLSAGEKAAFDLILDVVIKSEYFDDTLWCIDEPETHLNTRIQGVLLQTLVDLLPDDCQLFLASHSIGFMRKSWDLARADPGSVAFLDFQGIDFDAPASLAPVTPSREFWSRTLDVALGDVASLVAPEHIVLCEGRPSRGPGDRKAAFDAGCYGVIFAHEYPNTDFLSVGNSEDVGKDRLEFGRAIQALASGTRVTRLIDRDMRTQEEVDVEVAEGVRVLSRRHIESYLLDDEVLTALCVAQEQPDRADDALAIKKEQVAASVARGNDADDMKSPAGAIYTDLRRLLALTQAGSGWEAFAKSRLAPLLRPGMEVYQQLRRDIFDE